MNPELQKLADQYKYRKNLFDIAADLHASAPEFGAQIQREENEIDRINYLSEMDPKKATDILNAQQILDNVAAERKKQNAELPLRKRMQNAFTDSFGEGTADHRKAYWEGRELHGQDIESPRVSQMLGTNPTFTRTRDLLTHVGANNIPVIGGLLGSDENHRIARERSNLGLKETNPEIAAQMLGTLASDITQDRGRGLWWLLNAAQAVTSVGTEYGLGKLAPDLYRSDTVYKDNKPLEVDEKNLGQLEGLTKQGYLNLDPETGKVILGAGINKVDLPGKRTYGLSKRRYRPGNVDALMWPTGIAINAGVGLLNPLGGSGGYAATFQSEDDPTRTSNIVGEVAAKYVLGRTGQLLPWDEFKKVRPDVSKDEYMRYKAFKYDKNEDWNPLDGDLTVGLGALKGTMEGIHGPEIQYLGRSLPVTTGVIPVLAAGAGTIAGAAYTPEKYRDQVQFDRDIKKVRKDRLEQINREFADDLQNKPLARRQALDEIDEVKRKVWSKLPSEKRTGYQRINRVGRGAAAGFGSYAVGLGAGLLLENERRRRNQAENERNNQL